MEDTLFNILLFTGFYCLYSAMFAPKTTGQAVTVVPAAVQQPTQSETVEAKVPAPAIDVTPEAKPVDLVPTTNQATDLTNAKVSTVAPSAQQLKPDVEPDRDGTLIPVPIPIASNTGSTTAGFAKTTKRSSSSQSKERKHAIRQTALAS